MCQDREIQNTSGARVCSGVILRSSPSPTTAQASSVYSAGTKATSKNTTDAHRSISEMSPSLLRRGPLQPRECRQRAGQEHPISSSHGQGRVTGVAPTPLRRRRADPRGPVDIAVYTDGGCRGNPGVRGVGIRARR